MLKGCGWVPANLALTPFDVIAENPWGSSGDLRLSLLGAAIAGAGFLVVLVPIVAWGVYLGRRLGGSVG